MLQSIDNPQPMYIPTRISPDVVASSRQLIPLGTVEMSGKQYYKFDLGDSWYKAIKFYEVEVIRSINQMSENETMFGHIANAFSEEEQEELEAIATEIEQRPILPLTPTAELAVSLLATGPLVEPEAQADPAPGVEPEVESEPGAKIVRWYANNASDRQHAEKEIAALEAKGWIFRGISSVSGSDERDGEYSVLYVRPQAAVSS